MHGRWRLLGLGIGALGLSVIASLVTAWLVAGSTAERPAERAASAVRTVTTRTVTVERAARATKRRAKREVTTTTTPAATPPPSRVMCDANIRVKASTTTCPFAQNVFFAFWAHREYATPLVAYSRAAGRTFDLACASTAGTVRCSTVDGAEVQFPLTAVDAYDRTQAARYVKSGKLGDYPTPWEDDPATTPSTPAPEVSGDEPVAPADASTPRAYVPDTSSTPPGEEIPNYDEGRGSRVQCADGTFSHSGGIQGACSYHGGVG